MSVRVYANVPTDKPEEPMKILKSKPLKVDGEFVDVNTELTFDKKEGLVSEETPIPFIEKMKTGSDKRNVRIVTDIAPSIINKERKVEPGIWVDESIQPFIKEMRKQKIDTEHSCSGVYCDHPSRERNDLVEGDQYLMIHVPKKQVIDNWVVSEDFENAMKDVANKTGWNMNVNYVHDEPRVMFKTPGEIVSDEERLKKWRTFTDEIKKKKDFFENENKTKTWSEPSVGPQLVGRHKQHEPLPTVSKEFLNDVSWLKDQGASYKDVKLVYPDKKPAVKAAWMKIEGVEEK